MHAYILRTGRLIPPYERPAAAIKFHNVPLAEIQRRSLRRLGCIVHEIDDLQQVSDFPAVLINDDLFFTHAAVARFVRAARRSATNSQAAIRCSLLTEHMATAFQGEKVTDAQGVDHRRYACYFLKGLDPSRSLQQQASALPIPHRIAKLRYRTSRRFEPSRRYVVPVSLVYMTPVVHWACLVAANALGMPAFLAGMFRRRPLSCGLLPLKMALRAGSLRPSLLSGKSYLAGSRCRVHPSAHVEASVLGRGVRIAQHCVVRNSVLDDGVEIRAGAIVEGCTFGRNVIVESGCLTRGCVADDGAGLGIRFVQLSVFGRDAVICPETGIPDFPLRGTVKVDFEGSKVRSGSRFLGACLGDDAFVGPKVLVKGGTQLPNGCQLILDPRRAVGENGTELPADVIRVDRGRKLRLAS